ncbi:ankyrin repeat-containing domain protein, partial [Massariosphaeria phaeospora]
HEKVVGRLLTAGADPNVTDLLGATVLHQASSRGCSDTVSSLLRFGKIADVDVQNKGKKTSLFLAARSGALRVVEELLKQGADPNIPGPGGSYAIHAAICAANNRVELVKSLLDKGAQVDAKDHRGNTALCMAVTWGYDEVVKILLQRKADPKTCGYNGNTPLHHAIYRNGSWTLFCHLLDHYEGRVPIKNYRGPTPLRVAVVFRKIVFLELLLEREDVNDISHNDDSNCGLLRTAIEMGDRKIVELLLSKVKVESLPETDSWDWLLLCTRANKNEDVLEVLLEFEDRPSLEANNDSLRELAFHKNFSFLARSLLREGANPVLKDKYGWTLGYIVPNSQYRNDAEDLARLPEGGVQSPNSWSAEDTAGKLVVEKGLTVKCLKQDEDGKRFAVSSVRSDFPVPPGVETFYFEVTIVNLEPSV